MSVKKITRREFIATTSASLAATSAFAESKSKKFTNTLPQWRGFNFLDFFNPNPAHARPATPEIFFKWMRDWGFDFVRIPMAYPAYLNIDHNKEITTEEVYKFDEAAIEKIETLVANAHKHGLHVSLNLHRAPGYCINAGFHEPYNLWKDKEALEAFCAHWEMWTKRFKNTSSKLISFDLVNEPSWRDDMNDQFGKREALKPEVYHRVAKAAVERIRAIKPDALIVADGNSGGHVAVPELANLNIAQSCRGYIPFDISHHKAPWVHKNPEDLPTPTWPTKQGQDKKFLKELYQPWFELIEAGVGVHCGEAGCYKETPHDVFLAWFGDLLEVLAEKNIGFGLWEMRGDFGILDSGRRDVKYEDWYGYQLDSKLLQLLKSR